VPAAIGTSASCEVLLPPFNLCGPREYGLSCPLSGFLSMTAGGGVIPASCRPQTPGLLRNGPLCCPCE
jgi:hypothetical protein